MTSPNRAAGMLGIAITRRVGSTTASCTLLAGNMATTLGASWNLKNDFASTGLSFFNDRADKVMTS
ncbi:MAG: hypothetical protein AAF282_14205 [Cyanobacteria bacterium P01_A01_bin.15]